MACGRKPFRQVTTPSSSASRRTGTSPSPAGGPTVADGLNARSVELAALLSGLAGEPGLVSCIQAFPARSELEGLLAFALADAQDQIAELARRLDELDSARS